MQLLLNAVVAALGGTLMVWFLVPLYGSRLGPTEEEIAEDVYPRCLEYAANGVLHLQIDGGRWWNEGDDMQTVCEVVAYQSPNAKLGAASEQKLYERLSPFDRWAKAKALEAFYYYRPKTKPEKPAVVWLLQAAAIIVFFAFQQLRGRSGSVLERR